MSANRRKEASQPGIDSVQDDVRKVVSEIGDDFKGKRVLITGGAGFLGSWLCEATLKSNAEVTCVDNMSTGRMENIEHLLSTCKSSFRFINACAENIRIKDSHDYVFHFASRASPEEYQQHPIETLKANSLGTLNMLEHAMKGKSVMVYASTSEVYGDAQIVPTPETYWGNVNPIGVRSCYDEGKRFGEALCMAYSKEHGLDVRVARIFNTYGQRIRADGAYARALPRFINQALRNQPITIFGDGAQTRSFCYVSDTITGILKLAAARKLSGEVLNIGNPHEVTINELAKTIIELTSAKSIITKSPPQPDDPRRRKPDISKAMRMLNWKPTVGLQEGLKRTIEWFKWSTAAT